MVTKGECARLVDGEGEGMYPYRTVERALTRMHGDTGAAALRITARIKHFIRLGFTPESPGKGQRISYTFEDTAKWAYALQILEYGIDPTAMQFIVRQTWEKSWRALQKGNHGQNELLIATPRAISNPGSWVEFECVVMNANHYRPNWSKFFRRMIINLSAVSRELRAALAEAEAGVLRDLSSEINRIKAGETDLAHIKAALKNRTPGTSIAIGRVNDGPLITEIGSDGPRELLPKARRSKRNVTPG